MLKFYYDLVDLKNEVTGTCQLVIVRFPQPVLRPDGVYTDSIKFVVDCGMFEGDDDAQKKNFRPFHFNPEEISFGLLTHSHLDHYGRFPQMYKQKFTGKVYTTKVTKLFLKEVALDDCLKIITKSAKRAHIDPLYNQQHSYLFESNLVGCEFYEEIQYNDNIRFTFFPNGHLFGASMILVTLSYPGEKDINILFSGDFNNKNELFPIPELPKEILDLDINLVLESTYGSTLTSELPSPCFVNNIVQALNENKTIICPSFALGRTQENLWKLREAQDLGILSPRTKIYIDGPTAQKYTRLIHDSPLIETFPDKKDFYPYNLSFVGKNTRESVIIGKFPKIIVCSSGMLTKGCSQIYAQRLLSNPNVLFHLTGYCTPKSTAGKIKVANYGDIVQLGGLFLPKYADVIDTTECSAHAKQDELIEFCRQFSSLKTISLHHGEIEKKKALAEALLKAKLTPTVGILDDHSIFRFDSYGIRKYMNTNIL